VTDGEGLYVWGELNSAPIIMHVDCGASHTILPPSKLETIIGKQELDTSQAHNIQMSQADGSLVKVEGTLPMKVRVGQAERCLSVIVADIASQCILGRDYLYGVGAKIDCKNNSLIINNEHIPGVPAGELLVQVPNHQSSPSCYRLKVTSRTVIPAGHEMVISASAECANQESGKKPLGLVQPLPCGTIEQRGLLVARGVVDTKEQVHLMMCNVGDRDTTLKEGTVVATIHPLDESEIVDTECEQTVDNEDDVPEHVRDLLSRSQMEVPESERDLVRSVITKFAHVFSTGEGDIGRTGLVKHSINTGDQRPIRQRPRRAPRQQQEEIDRQVQMLLEKKLIEPTQSPWSTPVVLVAKKDSGWRLCCDYRRLNEATIKDAFPLPRIDETLDHLSGAQYFCTLDLASGYWQVELDDEAKQKSAFVVQSGLYSWNVMPFGLTNAPATFERLMERVLAGLHWQTLLVYLDDIIIYGRDIPETAARLGEVFQRLQSAGLKLKPSKCDLFKTSVNYLGHIVSAAGVSTDPKKIEAVQQWPVPRNVKEIRSFLGLASYYRRFVHQFAHIAQPLHRLTGKNTKFEWTSECQNAFEELKSRLISAPILAYPMDEGLYVLDTDASGFAIGAVLSQVQNGNEHVIAYASKMMSKEQRNYCVTRQELLAVVHFLKYFHHYLYGRHVLVRTDHAALKWLLNFKEVEGQLARWLQILSSYDIEIEHRPGVRHRNADALSRLPCKQCERQACASPACDQLICTSSKPRKQYKVEVIKKQVPVQTANQPLMYAEVYKVTLAVKTSHNLQQDSQCAPQIVELVSDENFPAQQIAKSVSDENIPEQSDKDTTELSNEDIPEQTNVDLKYGQVHELTHLITLKDIRAEQLKDPTMKLIMTTLESGEARPEWKIVAPKAPDLKAYWSQWNLLCIKDGILCRKWISDDGKGFTRKIILPHNMRETCFQELHESKAAGHLGYMKTLHRLRDRYYWIGMTADIRSYLRKCTNCARRKKPTKNRRARLRQYTVGAPLERVALDILGPLPETERGNIYVLVIADYFTKWVEILPLPDQTAETVAKAFTEEFVCRFGAPHEVHSDQGRNFESRVFAETLRLLGTSKTRTTPYNPKSDGMVERFNRTLLNMVSQMLDPLKHQRDWDDQLPYVGLAYRSAVHESTGETPNMLMMGHEITLPLDLMVESLPEDEDEDEDLVTDFALDLRERMQRAHEHARDVLQTSAGRQKRNYDRRAHGDGITEGSFVWLFSRARKPGITNKLRLPWEGPYLVIQKLSDVHVRIQKSPRAKTTVIHMDRLKPYTGPELVPWKYRKEPMVDRDQPESCETHGVTPTPQHGTSSQTDKEAGQKPVPSEGNKQQDDPIGTTSCTPPASSSTAGTEIDRQEAPGTSESQNPGLSNEPCKQPVETKMDGDKNPVQLSDNKQSGRKSSVADSSVPVMRTPARVKANMPIEPVADSPSCEPTELENAEQKAENDTTKSQTDDMQPRRNPVRKRQLPARYRLNQVTCTQPETNLYANHMALQCKKMEVPLTCELKYRALIRPQFSRLKFFSDLESQMNSVLSTPLNIEIPLSCQEPV